MAAGNDFFRAVQGSIEQAIAFWPTESHMPEGQSQVAARAQKWPSEALGRVVCIGGSQAVLEFHDGNLCEGQILKLAGEKAVTFAIVTILSVAPEDNGGPVPSALAEVELIGEAVSNGDTATFQFGLSVQPELGAFVFGLAETDFGLLYPNPSLPMGSCSFYKHRVVHMEPPTGTMGIFGAAHTGKTCALYQYISQILQQETPPYTLIFDVRGEYGTTFIHHQRNRRVDKLMLPYWVLHTEELAALLASYRHEGLTLELVSPALSAAMNVTRGVEGGIYLLEDLISTLDRGDRVSQRISVQLTKMRNDPEFAYLFPRQSDETALWRLLAQTFGQGSDGEVLTVLDFSALPAFVLPVIAAIYMRLVQHYMRITKGSVPLFLAIEQADALAPFAARPDCELSARYLYDLMQICAWPHHDQQLSICICARKPSEINVQLLPFIQSMLAFRLKSLRERSAIDAMNLDVNDALLDPLAILGKQEALWIGVKSVHPRRLVIDDLALDNRPIRKSSREVPPSLESLTNLARQLI